MQVNKNNIIKLDIDNNNKKYKLKIILNNIIYIKKLADPLLRFYHLIS